MEDLKAKCAACPPGSVNELENIRSHIGACALHWHKYSVDVAGIVVASAVALSGYVLTHDNLSKADGYALALVIAVIGFLGFVTIKYVKRQFFIHANILRKVDLLTGVFCKTRYPSLGGDMLYPSDWEVSGTDAYKEPLVEFASLAALVTPLVLSAIVALTVAAAK